MARRAERRELRGLPALLASLREELDVLGVRARPAALDEREAELVEHPGDAQLVGQGERDVLAMGAVAKGRVVEGDGEVGHRRGPRGTGEPDRVVRPVTLPLRRAPAG